MSTHEEPAAGAPAAPAADDVRSKYLEALKRKQNKAADSSPHDVAAKSSTPASNSKRQRTFRRKTGG